MQAWLEHLHGLTEGFVLKVNKMESHTNIWPWKKEFLLDLFTPYLLPSWNTSQPERPIELVHPTVTPAHLTLCPYSTGFVYSLKPLDTIGNCQRPVFSLIVSQHMNKITNLWKFELNWSLKLRENNGRKNILDAPFRTLDFETTAEVSQ